MPNIAIVWDFDGTLYPEDSTTKVIEFFGENRDGKFWDDLKLLTGKTLKNQTWEHILASEAPAWMYKLSRLALKHKAPLNSQFFKNFILPKIQLYENTIEFLKAVKGLENTAVFKKSNLEIHHFIVSAGLKELIEQVFPSALITATFGCRYVIVAGEDDKDEPESVPAFCMDETMKTRSIFEISKGSFLDEKRQVNDRVEKKNLWAPFENIIYMGDGDTDIPALSLVRSKGGLGIAVYNPKMEKEKIATRFKKMRLDKRTDLITPADFSNKSELYNYLVTRCNQIRQRYEAETVISA